MESKVKISIIHPSRNRASLAYECYAEWMGKASDKDNIQYILSIDYDDPALLSYNEFVNKNKKIQLIISENNNVVDAMNKGASISTGEILICLSDDFSCFKGWDEWILENINPENEEALSINDGLQPTTNIIMTMPIITRKLYDRLGFIYYPEYSGIFADNDLAERCLAMGVYKTNKTKVFKHNHWVTGERKKDETNERHDNIQGWELGRKILTEQRLINFGIKKQYA